jgi:hypothetical protein
MDYWKNIAVIRYLVSQAIAFHYHAQASEWKPNVLRGK